MKKFILFGGMALLSISSYCQHASFAPQAHFRIDHGYTGLVVGTDTLVFTTIPLPLYSWHDFAGAPAAQADYKNRGIYTERRPDPKGNDFVYLRQHVVFPFDSRNCKIVLVLYSCLGSACAWSYGVTPTSGYSLDYHIDADGKGFTWERITQASGAQVQLTVYYERKTTTN